MNNTGQSFNTNFIQDQNRALTSCNETPLGRHDSKSKSRIPDLTNGKKPRQYNKLASFHSEKELPCLDAPPNAKNEYGHKDHQSCASP